MVESAKAEDSKSKADKPFSMAYGLFQRANSLQPGLPAFNLACISALREDSIDARNWLTEAYCHGSLQGDTGRFMLTKERDLAYVSSEAWFQNLVALSSEGLPVQLPDYTIHFSGYKIKICQAHLQAEPGTKELVGTTGWTIWNSSFIILRYLERQLRTPSFELGRVLDLSGGLGLLGIACALHGASSTISEVGSAQIEAIKLNAQQNLLGSTIVVKKFEWGSKSALNDLGPLDLVLASDLLYIAIRENLEDELLSTLVELVHSAGTPSILFAFEVRLPHKEASFLKQLSSRVDLKEFASEEVDLSDIVAAAHDTNQEAANLGDFFYEQPDFKFYSLSARS